MSYERPINSPVTGYRQQLVFDVRGVEVQLRYVTQFVLSADTLLMLIFISAHPAFQDHLLYLDKIVPSILDVTYHTGIPHLTSGRDLFSLNDVFPDGHLLIYVTSSLHSVSCYRFYVKRSNPFLAY
jgi:hypothetical protein